MRRTITNEQGEKLDYKFHRAVTRGGKKKSAAKKKTSRPGDRPHLLLIGHGVTGDLSRPWAETLAEAAAASGINALRFSFSGNGESGGKFGEATITKEVGDLQAVMEAAIDAGYDVSYAGHSMGAAVGVICAAEDPDDRICNFISLAGMMHTRRFLDAEFGDITPGKGNMWGEKGCRLTQAFVEDLKSIDTVLPRLSEVHAPLLIVHGTADDVIPYPEARAAFDFANDPKYLYSIPNGDHVFTGPAVQKMIEVVVGWLKQRLKEQKVAAKEAAKTAAKEARQAKRKAPASAR